MFQYIIGIAVPLWEVSQRLGLPPVLGQSTLPPPTPLNTSLITL